MQSTQGQILAVMQVSGGSRSFSPVNTLRVLGRWIRVFTILNQLSIIAKAFEELHGTSHMGPSSCYGRIADVVKIWCVSPLTVLADRYSECKVAGHVIDPAAGLSAIAIALSISTEREIP